MRAILRVSEIVSVTIKEIGFTLNMVIRMENGEKICLSQSHYEESYRQRERCKAIKEVYGILTEAIRERAAYVEFEIED